VCAFTRTVNNQLFKEFLSVTELEQSLWRLSREYVSLVGPCTGVSCHANALKLQVIELNAYNEGTRSAYKILWQISEDAQFEGREGDGKITFRCVKQMDLCGGDWIQLAEDHVLCRYWTCRSCYLTVKSFVLSRKVKLFDLIWFNVLLSYFVVQIRCLHDMPVFKGRS
jgi:hypothetical protein